MSSTTITNGAPQLIMLGAADESGGQNVRQIRPNPIHFPKFWVFAQRGEAKEYTVGDGDLNAIFGGDTFDPLKGFYNHSTAFLQGVVAEGNLCRVKRLIPADAGPIANAFVSIEVLRDEIDDYVRNSDGSIKYVANAPVVKTGGKIVGYRARYVLSFYDGTGEDPFGTRTRQAGTWTGSVGGTATTSEIWPLFDILESSRGSDGNLTGMTFFAPRQGERGEQIDPQLIDKMKAYPFVFKLLRSATPTSTPQASTTLSGAQSAAFTFKPNARTPNGQQISFGDTLIGNYRRMRKPKLPDVPGFLSDVHVYDKNFADLLKLLSDKERAYIAADTSGLVQTDFTNAPDEDFRFNILGGTTYSGYPYHTFRLEAGQSGFKPSANSWVMLKGGSDGTMTNAVHAELVNAEMDRYINLADPINNYAVHRESVVYDTGFPLATKIRLLDVMANRKDIAVGLACFEDRDDADNVLISPTAYNATATTLKARALLYPESTWYGTGCSKVLIMGGSGKITGSPYVRRTSLLYELARKSARYMGQSSFQAGKVFEGAPNHMVEFMEDIDQTWAPVSQRVSDWSVGLNQVLNFSGENDAYFPAVVTIYEDDTSVLNSWITNIAMTAIWKAFQDVHAQTSGIGFLTKLQLRQRRENAMAKLLPESRFDNRLLLQVQFQDTEDDLKRNFSTTGVVRVGANGTSTVMTSSIEVYRWEDLVARMGANANANA